MKAHIVKAAILLVFSTFVSKNQAIRCYVCNSESQPDCADAKVPEKYNMECSPATALPLDNSSLSDSNEPPRVPDNANFTFCRKTYVTIPYQDNTNNTREGTTRMTRSCGFYHCGPVKDSCKRSAAYSGIKIRSCVCSRDGCNAASNTIPAILSLVFLATGALTLN